MDAPQLTPLGNLTAQVTVLRIAVIGLLLANPHAAKWTIDLLQGAQGQILFSQLPESALLAISREVDNLQSDLAKMTA